ncbi:hypothetical protein AB0K12_24845 [Nonomuraea sp. NPDC049419]
MSTVKAGALTAPCVCGQVIPKTTSTWTARSTHVTSKQIVPSTKS